MEIKKLIFNIKRKIMEYESKMNFYKKDNDYIPTYNRTN